MDRELLEKCRDVIDGKSKSIDIEMSIENCQRTFGSTLSYHLAMKYNEAGMNNSEAINVKLKGSAGQSFGAFLVKGVNFYLEGDANDYVGKGLSGGNLHFLTRM